MKKEDFDGIDLRVIAQKLRNDGMQCNCDLDNWEPENDTGHSWVCRIHKEAQRLGYLEKIGGQEKLEQEIKESLQEGGGTIIGFTVLLDGETIKDEGFVDRLMLAIEMFSGVENVDPIVDRTIGIQNDQ